MIQEFVNGSFRYKLATPSLILSKVRLNGVDISKYLTDQSQIGFYDVSKNSGRDVTNADGTMILNIIASKYRLDLATRPLTQDEMVDFFREIMRSPRITVEFLNPFTGNWQTINCYRGDRTAQTLLPVKIGNGLVQIYNSVQQAIIEL